MNKQELKEIVALYLPYGVEFKKKTCPYTILDLEDIADINYIEKGKGKLLLHPLSIVTDEWIEENVTIDIFPDSDIYGLQMLIAGDVREVLFRYSYGEHEAWQNHMDYITIKFLAKHHIDFANLIGKGYAIEREVGNE